jgi:hypothetical protein
MLTESIETSAFAERPAPADQALEIQTRALPGFLRHEAGGMRCRGPARGLEDSTE